MTPKKINLVAADMGYGHQRAAYPLLDLAGGEIITINNYLGIPDWEKRYWLKTLGSYERLSRFKKVPILGSLIFSVMDFFQKIPPLYPFRDLSKITIQQRYFFRAIKKGLGRDLIERLQPSGLPLVTTFFVAAYVAEYYNYAGDIYCVVCDTDASRAWAPLHPQSSRTKFLVPSEKVKDRLLMYGVRENNIIISGFPLPKENIGSLQELLKVDLARRVAILDRGGSYQEHYAPLLKDLASGLVSDNTKILAITYAVGGAGAQKEIGSVILNQLASQIKNKKIHLNLVAGNRLEIKNYFESEAQAVGLKIGLGLDIIFAPDKLDYFKKFNTCLRRTDILWTKPSELSFYCALGLPIIISPPVGSQEEFNKDWLLSIGAGLDVPAPEYINEWLPDLLESGRLAHAAVDGFLNAESQGTYKIEKLLGQL
ncbi:MAG: hypothetical protein WC863_03670 [Patescibacteria group bacterium]